MKSNKVELSEKLGNLLGFEGHPSKVVYSLQKTASE